MTTSQTQQQQSLSPGKRAWQRFCRNRIAFISLIFLGSFLFITLVFPLLSSLDPNKPGEVQFGAPSPSHWFGTDVHGRDLLARILYGARISLMVGSVGAVVSLLIGVTWGAISGYVGGRWDNAMMRVVDILYSLPSIIFVIVLITTLEDLFKKWLNQFLSVESASVARMLFLFIGLGSVSWLTMARIVRGEVFSIKERSFIQACRALGAGPARIIFKHILPNIAGIIIVYVTLTIPAVILYESFLSYLGLGIQPPQASLGSLIAEGASQINSIRTYWWIIVFPTATLASTLLALNFIGDGLRDAYDPKLTGR